MTMASWGPHCLIMLYPLQHEQGVLSGMILIIQTGHADPHLPLLADMLMTSCNQEEFYTVRRHDSSLCARKQLDESMTVSKGGLG